MCLSTIYHSDVPVSVRCDVRRLRPRARHDFDRCLDHRERAEIKPAEERGMSVHVK